MELQSGRAFVANRSSGRTRSGVQIAADFRDNLIIDRFDPMFVGMRASKLKHMRSANSEDAVTWNVFRSLRQIQPSSWLPRLFELGLAGVPAPPIDDIAVYLWATRSPPPSLLASGDEGDSEIDVLIESPSWTWAIEAKLYSDISTRTTTREGRDQIVRNIDVGSYHAGVRDFYFSFLIHSPSRSMTGLQAIERYKDLAHTRQCLARHRPDGLKNLRAVTLLTWANLLDVLRFAEARGARLDEREYASRAISWMRKKGLDDPSS
jgi:hypothetical protein